jgi:hypothetical protein
VTEKTRGKPMVQNVAVVKRLSKTKFPLPSVVVSL